MISTIGMSVWRAGCAGTCTSGSEGGPGKPTGRKSGRASRFDPTRLCDRQCACEMREGPSQSACGGRLQTAAVRLW